MPKIDSLEMLLTNELRDLLDAENRLTKTLPKLVKASSNEELKTALEDHLEQTKAHVTRVEKALKTLGAPSRAKTCHGMKGIVDEGAEHLGEEFSEDALKDATIIGAAQRTEHYEIAAYGTVLAYARQLGRDEIVSLLEPTLEEEKAADTKLTEIAEEVVNAEASRGEEENEEQLVGAGEGRGGNRAGMSRRQRPRRTRTLGDS